MGNRLRLAAMVLIASCGSAYAQIYEGILSGAAENPPNASLGTGTTTVTVNIALNTLQIDANFSGLTGTTTVAHIHCCIAPPMNAGVATQTPSFAGFPAGVTAGTYSNTFDMTLASSFNAAFITANGGTTASAFVALTNGIANGQAYLNIHTSLFGGGEIRGFLTKRSIFADGFEGP